jgi:hypothetical protein
MEHARKEYRSTSRNKGKVTTEQYDQLRHTVGRRETQEVHEFEDEDGWPHTAYVINGVVAKMERRAPDQMLPKLRPSRTRARKRT